MKLLSEKIVDILKEEYSDVQKKGKQFIVSGKSIKQTEFVDVILKPLVQKHNLVDDLLPLIFDSSYHAGLINEATLVFDDVCDKRIEESKPKLNLYESTEVDVRHISPFMGYKSGKVVLYDNTTTNISEMHVDVYMRLSSVTTKKSDKQDNTLAELPLCTTDVNPFSMESLYMAKIDSSTVYVINEYKHPRWMKKLRTKHESISDGCPEDMDKFLTHLCLNTESKEAVVDWIAQAVWNRSQTHLCLNGDKEIGKSFFASIFKALVGDEYVKEAPKSLGKKDFNLIFKESRIIIHEELSITKAGSGNIDDSTHEFLKRVANDTIAIEGKGTNAETIRNITSQIICNNNLGSLQIDSNDRRFLVPELTTINPNDVGLEEVLDNIFRDYINPETRDHEKVSQFGYWLKHCGMNRNPRREVYKGPRFREAVRANLTDWQEFLVQKVEEMSRVEYSLRDARKEFHKLMEDEGSRSSVFPRKLEKIQALFDNFLDSDDGVKLATARKLGMDVLISPLGKYKPSVEVDYVQVGVE